MARGERSQTDELGVGQACRHRQQIGSVAAAELENAAGRHAWRCETEQRGDHRHVVRMRQRIRLPLVRDGVILLDQRRVGRAIAQAHSLKMRRLRHAAMEIAPASIDGYRLPAR
jgi:hypothetical protein